MYLGFGGPALVFLRETVERCEKCDAVTPHRRHAWMPVKWFCAALALVGFASLAQGAAGIALGFVLLYGSVFAFNAWRETFEHVPCQRCRGKLLHGMKKTKPKLDGTTEIQLFVGM